jgi:hypothetical protein
MAGDVLFVGLPLMILISVWWGGSHVQADETVEAVAANWACTVLWRERSSAAGNRG